MNSAPWFPLCYTSWQRHTASAVRIPFQAPKANLLVPGEAVKKKRKEIMQKSWEQIYFPSCSSSTLINGLLEKAQLDCICRLDILSIATPSLEFSTFGKTAAVYNASLFKNQSLKHLTGSSGIHTFLSVSPYALYWYCLWSAGKSALQNLIENLAVNLFSDPFKTNFSLFWSL